LSEDERPDTPAASDMPAPWERPWAASPRPARSGQEPEAPAVPTTVAAQATPPASGGSPGKTAPPTRPTRLQAKRARRRRRATLLRRCGAGLAAVLVFLVTGTAWGLTQYLNAKVHQVEALDQGSANVQDRDGQRGDENYLLVGSDSRAGANGDVGAGTTEQAGGARSDTVMLAHVPADRSRVVVVSFPRDLEIDRPACAEWNNAEAKYSNVTAPPETQVKLNSAYSVGGPKCLVQVIQQISGLQINHFVGVDFNGFEALVNQIGGVDICTTSPLVDNELGTILPEAGTHLVNGQTALSYVRARKVDAEGTGDYGRIKRQQRFLSALLRKAMSTDVLLDFRKLTGFINGFTAATFGENMGTDSLITLGQSLKGLSAGRVTFLTVPTKGTRYGNEIPNTAEIGKIFHAIIDGTPLPGERGSQAPTTAGSPTPTSPAPAAKPGGSARIDVLNATTTGGLAGTAAKQLTDIGYTVGNVGTATQTLSSTSIRYSADQSDAAKQLAASIPNAQLEEVTGLGSTIELVLGGSFAGKVSAPSTAPTSDAPLPPNLSVVNAADASCG